MSDQSFNQLSTAAFLKTNELSSSPEGSLCPQCRTPLSDPEGLGACETCGYCRALEQKTESHPGTAKRPSSLGVSEFQEMFSLLPTWMAVMIGGAFLILAGCLLGNHLLPSYSHERAFWGMGQVVGGLVAVVAAHTLAFRWTSLNEVTTVSRGRFSLYGLWRTVFERLPDSRWSVNLLAWGVTGILSAVFIIGGWGWWIDRILEKPADWTTRQQEKEQRAREAAGVGFGKRAPDGETDELPVKTPKPAAEKDDPTVVCAIVGYQANATRVTEVVLARPHQGRMIYAGVINDVANPAALKAQLSELKQEKCEVAGIKMSATWVRLVVFCEVYYSSLGSDGLLENPRFKRLVE